MRVRTMSASGDMTFGQGSANFLANSPAAVAQIIGTRLRLWQGEWFLDTTVGTPYMTKILGTHSINLYDQAIIARILETPGVISIAAYSSVLNPATRKLTILANVITQWSTTGQSITATISLPG